MVLISTPTFPKQIGWLSEPKHLTSTFDWLFELKHLTPTGVPEYLADTTDPPPEDGLGSPFTGVEPENLASTSPDP